MSHWHNTTAKTHLSTRPWLARMRCCSSGCVGLWSVLRSMASQLERQPFFFWRPSTMRLSPTQAVVRVRPCGQGSPQHPGTSAAVQGTVVSHRDTHASRHTCTADMQPESLCTCVCHPARVELHCGLLLVTEMTQVCRRHPGHASSLSFMMPQTPWPSQHLTTAAAFKLSIILTVGCYCIISYPIVAAHGHCQYSPDTAATHQQFHLFLCFVSGLFHHFFAPAGGQLRRCTR